MPLPSRARAVAVSAALLAGGCLVTSAAPAAVAAVPEQVNTAAGCVQPGPTLRYLVVFDRGTSQPLAEAEIEAACGTPTVYYPQIAVAVATSPDPGFGRRMGLDRAYSAQAEAISKRTGAVVRKKTDETEIGKSSRSSAVDRTVEQWDMDMIKAAEAHAISRGNRSVVVGVLDSGIDPTHPDLVGALDPALSAGCAATGKADPSVAAWSPSNSSHGTHVAGTIAAADDGHGITGVAPGVRIASVKVVDNDGYIYPEYALCGFMWAAVHGMTITNNSYFIDPWVFTCQNQAGQKVVYEAVQRAVEYSSSRGVLTVAAVGNAGADLSKPGRNTQGPTNAAEDVKPRPVDNTCLVLPAQLRNVVGVSSVGAAKVKTGYSSYGLGAVDVTAPGGDRKQVPASTASTDGCVLSTVPAGYDYACGTSMATPHVSGVAALLASVHPGATAPQLSRLLNAQAETLPCPANYDLNGTGVQDAYCTGYSEYNGFYGHGLVNALAAVTK